MAFLIKYSTVENADTYKPLINNVLFEDEETIPSDIAYEACSIILEDEDLDQD